MEGEVGSPNYHFYNLTVPSQDLLNLIMGYWNDVNDEQTKVFISCRLSGLSISPFEFDQTSKKCRSVRCCFGAKLINLQSLTINGQKSTWVVINTRAIAHNPLAEMVTDKVPILTTVTTQSSPNTQSPTRNHATGVSAKPASGIRARIILLNIDRIGAWFLATITSDDLSLWGFLCLRFQFVPPTSVMWICALY